MTPASVIPLSQVPAQTIPVQLGDQACVITLYHKRTGLYLDLSVRDKPIVTGVLCRDRVWLVRNAYLGFVGDLALIDLQGRADPDWGALGSRFVLVWGR